MLSETPTDSKNYFPALTGIRAIVAALVFFYHCIHERLADGSIELEYCSFPEKVFYLLVHKGQIGVTIFFVLSGFLITTRYSDSIQVNTSWFSRYLQNRFARIYPIYFLLTALTFAVMLSRPPYEWYEWPITANLRYKVAGIALNILLLRSYLPSFLFLGVPTAWTLTIEETFYICAPFLIIGLKHNFRRFYLYPLTLLVIGTLLVVGCSYLTLHDAQQFTVEFMLSATFFGRCVEFIAGIALGLWLGKASAKTKPRRATFWGGLGIAFAAIILAIIERTAGDKSGPPIIAFIIINNFILPFPTTLLLWGLIKERTLLQRLLSTKVLDLLGKSSYAFYLIHIGVIDTLFNSHLINNWAARFVFHTLLSIGLYKYFERPLQKFFRVKAL